MKHLLTALVVVLSAALPGEQILGSAAGAGCSRRYLRRINGKCYYFSVKKMNWHGALNNCLRKGLTLADLSNPRDFYGAIGFLSSKGNTEDFWFGGNDLQHEGRFQYISNGRLVRFFSNYSIVEPAEHSECDDCLEVRIRSNMTVVADDNCLERQYFICSERYCDDSGAAAKPKHHSHEHLHHFHHDIGDSDGDEKEVNDAPHLTSGSVEHEGSESEGAVEFADLPDELNAKTSTTQMMAQMDGMLTTDMGPPPSDLPPTTVKDEDEDEEGSSDEEKSSTENSQRKLGSSDETGEDEERPPGDGLGTPTPPPEGEGSTPAGTEGDGETKSGEGGVTTAGEGGETTAGEGGVTTAGEGGVTTAGEGATTAGGEDGATTTGEVGGTPAGKVEGAAAGGGAAAGKGEKNAAGEGGETPAAEGETTAAAEGGATTAAPEGEATTAAAEGETGAARAPRANGVPRSQRAAQTPLAAIHHLI
ncbi:uncharacterized transmembrane protein DDB_G0289901 isoform X2 [Drosophila guanche]|uniref:uncharacterized transmembrane protein DDB_G0289901 isoform X2 n=1 Tax=Drosophila guanche TaxID=7266 RepID=UPI001470AA9C|nr:uncharacterized transmembrane protein DDB_G0289901 isoform X2 [Drosophila guanche]